MGSVSDAFPREKPRFSRTGHWGKPEKGIHKMSYDHSYGKIDSSSNVNDRDCFWSEFLTTGVPWTNFSRQDNTGPSFQLKNCMCVCCALMMLFGKTA